jgi:hypothetical protein
LISVYQEKHQLDNAVKTTHQQVNIEF